jgi:lambda family phage portal protein
MRRPTLTATKMDRLVGLFSPSAQLARMKARMGVMAISGSWAGARHDRDQTAKWATRGGDPDADTLDDLPTLRERSRSLLRDNPLAAGAVNTVVSNVVGTGLMLRSQPERAFLGWNEQQSADWAKKVEGLWRLWAESKSVSLNTLHNFYEIQSLATRSTLESGDSLVVLPHKKRPGDFLGLKLQVVESDRLLTPPDKSGEANFSGGVELNSDGAPSAYHITKFHPGSRRAMSEQDFQKIPARTKRGTPAVLHLYVSLRPDQHRGVPYLSTVIETLRELGEYTTGELRAAVVSGMYTLFVTSDPANGGGLLDGAKVDLPASSNPAAPRKAIELGYGSTFELDPGEKIENFSPNRPNQAFDPFVLAMLRQIGVALELPFEVLVKHFTASYSAARAALLELAKFVRSRRAWLATNLCQPVYEAFLEECVASGLVDAPGFFDDPILRLAYCSGGWTGDSLGQIDMGKEIAAWSDAVDAGFSTRTEATAALFGRDWDVEIERRATEDQRIEALDVHLGKPTPIAATATPVSAPDGTDNEALPSVQGQE